VRRFIAQYIKLSLSSDAYYVAGDKIRDGVDIKVRDEHFTDDTAPKDFNTRQILVSPSIRYAGHHAYATPTKYVYFHSRNLQPSYLKGRLPVPLSRTGRAVTFDGNTEV